MPWHKKPKKDVVACVKPRGGGKQPLIRGYPNGETQHGKPVLLRSSSVACAGTM